MVKSEALHAPVQALLLEHNDCVPSNPRLPVLIYIKAVAIDGSDPAALFEKTFSARSGRSDAPRKTDNEKGLMDFIIDLIAHRIGVFVLGLLSGGRFKGESGLPGAGHSSSAG